jgi:precorrin-2 dehydrogenase/sirohydrochlorin ferrochelatase
MSIVGPLYPVNLVVAGKPCLVVGGGRVAARKADELVRCRANVRVVAVDVSAEMRGLEGVEIDERPYRAGEVSGYVLAIAATDDPAVNHAVFADGEAAGVWVNSADDPANCAFTLPARIRRGDLLVTVSTGGTSPALASWLRGRLDADLGPEFATLLDILSEERNALKAAGRSTEGLDWQSALESGMLDLVREGRLAEAKERLQACLSSSSG